MSERDPGRLHCAAQVGRVDDVYPCAGVTAAHFGSLDKSGVREAGIQVA